MLTCCQFGCPDNLYLGLSALGDLVLHFFALNRIPQSDAQTCNKLSLFVIIDCFDLSVYIYLAKRCTLEFTVYNDGKSLICKRKSEGPNIVRLSKEDIRS